MEKFIENLIKSNIDAETKKALLGNWTKTIKLKLKYRTGIIFRSEENRYKRILNKIDSIVL